MLYVLTILCLSRWALAQITLDGPCPNVTVMQDFNFTKFAGVWYEIGRTELSEERSVIKCVKSNYTIEDNGYARMIWSYIYRKDGRLVTYAGRVYPRNPAEPALIKTKYERIHDYRTFEVLDTDYESFSVLYACRNGLFAHMMWITLQTREQNPTEAVMETAWKFVDNLGIPRLMLTKIKQTDCELKADKPMT